MAIRPSLVFGVFPGKAATISGLTVRNAQSGIWNDGTVNRHVIASLSGNSYAGLSNVADGGRELAASYATTAGDGLYSYRGEINRQ